MDANKGSSRGPESGYVPLSAGATPAEVGEEGKAGPPTGVPSRIGEMGTRDIWVAAAGRAETPAEANPGFGPAGGGTKVLAGRPEPEWCGKMGTRSAGPREARGGVAVAGPWKGERANKGRTKIVANKLQERTPAEYPSGLVCWA